MVRLRSDWGERTMWRTVRWGLIAAIVAVVVAVSVFSVFFTDMWWFQALGYLQLFGIQIGWLWGVGLGVGLVAALFIFVNLWLTRSSVTHAMDRLPEGLARMLSWRGVRWAYVAVSVVLGVLYGTSVAPAWQRIALYLNRQPFALTDPIYHKDIGYYVFTLPFLGLINYLGLGLFALTLLLTGGIYLLAGTLHFERFRLYWSGRARAHLSLLLAGLVGLRAWRYHLDLYHLLYSPRGAVYGATYTDMHANALALRVLMVLALLVALGILINLVVRRGTRLIIGSLGMLVVASVVLGVLYPAAVQKFVVEPNELVRESPYIANHIAMTRAAFGLSDIATHEIDPRDELTASQLAENRATIDNIRLWDWRPLLTSYGQLQEFRLYYDFADVDIDRYRIADTYQQVMLSAREIDVNSLQNPSWINQHLQYTHGYGLVASPVNRVTPEGMPEFLVSDIPPHGVPEMRIDRPEIYFGERTNQYVVVNTKTPEFDYPRGDENATTTYQGHGGVQLSNPLRRLAFLLRFGTAKLILSTDIHSQSRIMFYRNIHDRVRRIAPFLSYDSDPYMIAADGRLYWVQDAYTTTDGFPYARPVTGWGNYVRNSVKVVTDAYNGDVRFYLVDDTEPLAVALDKVYGGLFRPIEEMPKELRAHIRYPEDLFKLQVSLFRTYHMTNTQVFYNQEDAWAVPNEVYGSKQQPMEPYYTIMRLPGEDHDEFVFLIPFTPSRKDNMVAWLAARNDGDAYGELVLYRFPKQSLTFGPAQIEARIDQDTHISQQLTLWSQKGSEVMRGNLLVVPIADTLLFVEPLFLQAEQSRLPELKRVIVAEGSRVVIGETLAEALDILVGRQPQPSQPRSAEVRPSIAAVSEAFNRAEQRLKNGDWQGFGRAMAELKQAIKSFGDAR
jgi:uncharacterized membrane protein (UPF0182 family)